MRRPIINAHGTWQDALAAEPGLDVYATASPSDVESADLVVLPGSRSTLADLDWLRRLGLADALLRRAAAGGPILGICGGYQMLTEQIDDPVESARGTEPGLGLLPARVFTLEEQVQRTLLNLRRTATPLLAGEPGSVLVWMQATPGRRRLGASALAQVYGQLGDEGPDVAPRALAALVGIVRGLRERGALLAYHDVADGGLFATLAEMAFASRAGLDVRLDEVTGDPLAVLFAEEVEATVVVVGSRGHGAIKRALLGSVSDHLVRHAPCPVLVVRDEVEEEG
mgnify:CR=1 FL=1